MNKKVRWITETAAMLALLIALQWLGSLIPEPMIKQLITGTFVNCVLVVTVLLAGRASGIAVALLSPVFALLFKITPIVLAAPVIMVGNVCYVLLISLIMGKNDKPIWKQPIALVAASAVKFAILYFLGVWLLCGLLEAPLTGHMFMGKAVMSQEIGKKMTKMFGWMQLITAVSGGTLALLIVPTLRKALRK